MQLIHKFILKLSMQDIRIISANPALVQSKIKLGITYFSILLFIGLVGFVSISVKDYVSDSMSITLATPEATPDDSIPKEDRISVTIKKGDTLKAILTNQDLPKQDISKIIKILEDNHLTSTLKIGQEITFDYETKILENDNEDLASETSTLKKIVFVIDKISTLEITREGDNFIAQSTSVPLKKLIAKSSAIINSSFMSALKSLGLSTNSIIELINAYSYQIDFQRQIQPGDTINVITEKFTTENGALSHHGKVLYASLILSGKEYNIYRYCHDNSENSHSFFSEDGKSVKRSLLKTPINIVRISSHYGNRKDPFHGCATVHRGIDFAAPEGTPIYAAGDGVITEVGWRAGYGKIVQIKHSPTLTTVYAHASRFGKVKRGIRVKQGQVIAYVGSTGRATGSHLHYEVKIDGKHVNPASIKTTPDLQLKGYSLSKFNQFKNKIKTLNTTLENKIAIAENEVAF
jgi:murein DD-endopeptidase MepM/ murein hydrolase activator NlpD